MFGSGTTYGAPTANVWFLHSFTHSTRRCPTTTRSLVQPLRCPTAILALKMAIQHLRCPTAILTLANDVQTPPAMGLLHTRYGLVLDGARRSRRVRHGLEVSR